MREEKTAKMTDQCSQLLIDWARENPGWLLSTVMVASSVLILERLTGKPLLDGHLAFPLQVPAKAQFVGTSDRMIRNSTQEHSLIPSGIGTLRLSHPTPGASWIGKLGGYLDSETKTSLTIRVKVNKIVITETVLILPPATKKFWEIELETTLRQNNQVVSNGHFTYDIDTHAEHVGLINPTSVLVNAKPLTLDVTAQWETASVNTTIVTQICKFNS